MLSKIDKKFDLEPQNARINPSPTTSRNMKKLFRVIEIFTDQNSLENLKRFSLPVMCTIGLTTAWILIVLKISSLAEIAKFVHLLANGFFAFLALKLYAENRQWKSSKYLSYAALTFVVISFVSFNESYNEGFGAFFTLGLFLLVIAAPFLGREPDNALPSIFTSAILSNSFFAFLSAAILTAGTYAIWASIKYLFGIEISSKLPLVLTIIYFHFLIPLYLLAWIPKDFSKKEECDYPRDIKFITLFVMVPLVSFYMAILYAYMVKILMLQELPKGILGYMISAFGIIGAATHFLTFPLIENANRLAKLFYRYFYHLLIIPVLLLFWSIALRISDYGVTERRYFLVLLTIWFASSCFYMVFSARKKLVAVPTILSILLIFTLIGPWSASSISTASQIKRLESLLKQEHLLQDGKIVKPDHELPLEYKQNVSSIIYYLALKKEIGAIKKWFPKDSYISNANSNSYIDGKKIIEEDLGFTYVPASQVKNDSKGNEVSFFTKNPPDLFNAAIDIRGNFDYIISFSSSSKPQTWANILYKNKDAEFKITIEGEDLVISDNKGSSTKINLEKIINDLKNSKQEENDFTLLFNQDNFRIKIYIRRIWLTIHEGNIQNKEYNITGMMLVKTPNH
ncbi:MAG: hypothetical protein K0R25_1125 [Rickettsiaceae bacterium]|jgi:hypothetical protein|nr:hypothetical protein [Rickettsiaceae bacterium]